MISMQAYCHFVSEAAEIFSIKHWLYLIVLSCVCPLLQDCICTTLAVKYSQNVWVIQVFSSRVVTATSTMAFTPQPSVRSHPAAVCASSTTRTLPVCSHSPSHMATRPCLNSPRCARYGWVLWKVGVPSTIDRMSRARRAGLRFI